MDTTIDLSKIENMTLEILQETFKDDFEITPPIKLSPILEKYGFEVKSGEFPVNTISGAADIKNKIIYISKDDPFPRQAFTIAHEFAHYILKNGSEKDIFYRSNLLNLDKEQIKDEIEANAFAASLLMPSHLVRTYWSGNKDIVKMSLWFGVTKTACYLRLKNLNIK